MVRAPTPEEEDRRRVGRERRALMVERVQHVNRIKGLLFAQGIYNYEPMRDVRGEKLQMLLTGDGRPLSRHLLMHLRRELELPGVGPRADQGRGGRAGSHGRDREDGRPI
jgi:transposase